jgi:hypothetical protein
MTINWMDLGDGIMDSFIRKKRAKYNIMQQNIKLILTKVA